MSNKGGERDMKDGGPAFACAAENGHQPGMSLRDYFAIHASDEDVSAMMRRIQEARYPNGSVTTREEARWAIADAMLSRR